MNSIKLFLIALFSLALTSASHSQEMTGTLRGLVLDSGNGETYPFAKITLKDSEGKIIGGVYSDLDGRYQIITLEPGKYSMECSTPGYETVKKSEIVIKPGAITKLDILIRESRTEVEMIKIECGPDQDKLACIKPMPPYLAASEVKEIPIRDIRQVASQCGLAKSNSIELNSCLVGAGSNLNVRENGDMDSELLIDDGKWIPTDVEIDPVKIVPIDLLSYEAKDAPEGFSWSCFPNPTTNNLKVEFNETVDEIILVDLSGKILMQQNIDQELQINLDLENLPTGIYFLQISHNGNWYTEQIRRTF